MSHIATLEHFYDPESQTYDAERAGLSVKELLAYAFAALGDEFGAALVTFGRHRVEREYHGEYVWRLSLPPNVYVAYRKKTGSGYDFESQVRDLGGPHFESIRSVIIQPLLQETQGWEQGFIDDYFRGRPRPSESEADTLVRLLGLSGGTES